jgi:hypothetical protein
MKKLVAALLLSTVGTAAWAGVIYRWETVRTSPTISSAVGYVEISHRAFLNGGANYVAPPHCAAYGGDPGCDNRDLSSPVLNFYFRVNAPSPTGADIDLHVRHGSGMRFPLDDWFSASFSLQDRYMNLSMFANTGETDMRMLGNTITRFGSDSDYFGQACFEEGCSGAEGQWVQVPEPGTLGLLGIGALGLVLKLRRQKRAAL